MLAEYRLGLWDEERLELMLGQVCAILANQWRGRGEALRPKDFMPSLQEEEREQTIEEQMEILRATARAR